MNEPGRQSDLFELPAARPPRVLPLPRLVRRPEAKDIRLVPLGFLTLIGLGAGLLAMPACQQTAGSLSWIDAIFMSVSATCVTGLATVNVAETFNRTGATVLLLLIQTGGIGISTAATLFVLLSGGRLSLQAERGIQASLGRIRRARPVDVFLYSLAAILICELAGVLLLFNALNQAEPLQAPLETLWQAAFHSVSAFCNAGISIWPDGLSRWREYPGVLLVMDSLVVAGGIGLLTLVNLRYYYPWRKDTRRRGQLSLQTRLSLVSAAVLILLGAAAVMVFEPAHTLLGCSMAERFSWALTHSINCRTAGFSVVDLNDMHPATLFFSIGLMFIGGAPGSMAGGIKSVTFVVLSLMAWAALNRREEIQLFHRRIPVRQGGVAVMLALSAGLVLAVGLMLLMVTENGQPAGSSRHGWLALAFEATSAFGTVGLSAGITPMLTLPGKLIVIALMFVGRVGPLMLAMHLSGGIARWRVRYPSEEVSLG